MEDRKHCPLGWKATEINANATRKHEDTYQFAVVVFAIAAVLDVVCVRSLLLTQQPCKLGTVGGAPHRHGVKRGDKVQNFPEKLVLF